MEKIKKNIRELKGKLMNDPSPLTIELYRNVDKISITSLSWNNPLASQVISDDSIVVKECSSRQHENFMVKIYFILFFFQCFILK